jgi:hypothetical protein
VSRPGTKVTEAMLDAGRCAIDCDMAAPWIDSNLSLWLCEARKEDIRRLLTAIYLAMSADFEVRRTPD